MAVGIGQVRQVDIEELFAPGTTMLRVRDNQVSGPIGRQIAQVVQCASERSIAIGQMPAMRTFPSSVIPRTSHVFGLGQVFNTSDALGDVGQILSWSSHPDILPEEFRSSRIRIGLKH
jgi:hypothetical protein